MYDPIQDGIDKTALSVRYAVEKPPTHLSSVVHCYWELRTEAALAEERAARTTPTQSAGVDLRGGSRADAGGDAAGAAPRTGVL